MTAEHNDNTVDDDHVSAGDSTVQDVLSVLTPEQLEEEKAAEKNKYALWTFGQFGSVGVILVLLGLLWLSEDGVLYAVLTVPLIGVAWLAWWQRSMHCNMAEAYGQLLEEKSKGTEVSQASTGDSREANSKRRLEQLRGLANKGLITQEEYEKKRREILESL